MTEPEDIRARVRRKRKKPPAVASRETREERVLRKLAESLEDPVPSPGGMTPRQIAWYWGTAGAFITALERGVFQRGHTPNRKLVRRVQLACARWLEGTTDQLPDGWEG